MHGLDDVARTLLSATPRSRASRRRTPRASTRARSCNRTERAAPSHLEPEQFMQAHRVSAAAPQPVLRSAAAMPAIERSSGSCAPRRRRGGGGAARPGPRSSGRRTGCAGRSSGAAPAGARAGGRRPSRRARRRRCARARPRSSRTALVVVDERAGSRARSSRLDFASVISRLSTIVRKNGSRS